VDAEAPALGKPHLELTVTASRKKRTPSSRLIRNRQNRAVMELGVHDDTTALQIPGNQSALSIAHQYVTIRKIGMDPGAVWNRATNFQLPHLMSAFYVPETNGTISPGGQQDPIVGTESRSLTRALCARIVAITSSVAR
jgi:hypothetical protein